MNLSDKIIFKLEKIRDIIIYDIPRFFNNLWYFRKLIWEYRDWDYHYVLLGLEYTLIPLEKRLRLKGNEIFINRNKKIKKIQRAIEILKNINDDLYLDIAQSELGEITYSDKLFDDDSLTDKERNLNNRVYIISRNLQEQEWEELFTILKGKKTHEGIKDYDEWYDGSCLMYWWD